jgi:hypothetical protein
MLVHLSHLLTHHRLKQKEMKDEMERAQLVKCLSGGVGKAMHPGQLNVKASKEKEKRLDSLLAVAQYLDEVSAFWPVDRALVPRFHC